MSDILTSTSTSSNITSDTTSDAAPMPMERLEARICELAGHLTAATCQFLMLVADFDARQGWADWEMPSCAAWLSWRCQIAPGTARDQVRVARALGGFPLITAEFAAGRLSYAKVRALTRIATPATEAGLAEIAGPLTGNQLERFVRAHRQVPQRPGHPDMLAGGARAHLALPRQPRRAAGHLPVSPAPARVEVPQQDQEPAGGRGQVPSQLADLRLQPLQRHRKSVGFVGDGDGAL